MSAPSGVDGFDRRPRGDSLIILRSHRHSWGPHGTKTHPVGRTTPTYICHTCGEVGYDYRQGYGGIDPDTGQPMPDTRAPREDQP